MLTGSTCKVFLLCILIQVQNGLGNNVARGKKAYQSTTTWNGDAQRATDGNANSNYWAHGCTHTDDGANPNWLVVDLEHPHTVNSVKLVNRLDCCTDRLQQFTVSISTDSKPTFTGNNVTPNNAQLCEFHQAAVHAEISINCKGLVGRFIFIAKTHILTLCEVEAYGTLIPQVVNRGANIAKGMNAYQSTTTWNGDARRATDGNVNSNYWGHSCTHTDDGAYQNWLVVDLEYTHAVSSVRLVNRLDCCTDRLQQFTVSISEESKPTFNGNNVTPTNAQLCEFHQTAVKAEISIDCKGHVGRFIFIAKTHILTLCEVEAYGTRTQVASNSGPNIAKGKNAYQSTTTWDGDARRATDGNANSNYWGHSCTHTDDGAYQNWLVVDLQQPHHVNFIVLHNRLDCCTDRLQQFTVSISNENKPTFTGNNLVPNNALLCLYYHGAVGKQIGINCKGQLGRFIFIAKTHILTLCEVEAFGSNVILQNVTNLGPNIAKGKKATQSTLTWGGEASRATDGNVNPNWAGSSCTHTDEGKRNWLVVDLGHSYDVTYVKLFNRDDGLSDRLKHFTVSISQEEKPIFNGDGIQPTNAEQCIYQRDAVGKDILINCKGLTGRYIVIAKDLILTLCEVEAFGNLNENTKIFKNNLYFFEKKKMLSWQEAKSFCQTLWNGEGRLANVETGEENEFIVKNFNSADVWLGGNDIRHEGYFAWSNDCPVEKSRANAHWSKNQPDNCCANGEHCMHMWSRDHGKWNDIDCALKMHFVCERETQLQQCTYLGPNIAVGKKAWQSSTTWEGAALRAIDGNTDQHYFNGKSCSHTENSGRNYFFVDLGDYFNVTNIEIFNRLDCCSDRLADFSVSVGYVSEKDRVDLKFNGLVPVGFQECVYRREGVSSSLFINCHGKVGQHIAVVKRSDILTICELKAYGYKTKALPTVCRDNDKIFNINETWRNESKCQEYRCTANGIDIVATGCSQDGKCYKNGETFYDKHNCLKMQCESSSSQGMQIAERGCRHENECKIHQQSYLETATCRSFTCKDGKSELQETGCRINGVCVKHNETLHDRTFCRVQQCQQGRITLISQGCRYHDKCVEQGFQEYNNKTCDLYKCQHDGEMGIAESDCAHDDGCLKSLKLSDKTFPLVPTRGKDESCKYGGHKYIMCRCLETLLYLIDELGVESRRRK